ncbi:U11/U12 small nuclear ribonucleoprotein 48 kDa protein [Nelusetta ayraudi]|uniref:U11/U12 small nuclear ribonucleoprotein 48 kDa protein n=1 Tax=Nelusetta ayraudi TaxID=303726 RepID=UPI003F6F2D04
MDSTPTDTVQDRLDRVQELNQFTEKCTKQLEKLIHRLGLSADCQELRGEALQQCPYDRNHRVPARSLDKHSRWCRLRRMGYSAEEQAEMVDTSVCYEKSNVRSFVMDEETQHQVIQQARAAAPLMKMEGVFWQGHYSSSAALVPHNHKRAVCDLTVADRLALYDHVIGALKQQQQQEFSANQDDLYVDLVSKLQKEEGASGPKTPLELMAEMRDYKRRRQSYRAKNVHITKKSYTEVIREVISVHSEELSRQWGEEQQQQEESRSAPPTSRSSSSSESRPPHSRHRHHRSREPESNSSKKKKKKKKKKKEEKRRRSSSRGRSRSRESRSPESRPHRRRKERE